MVWKYIDENTDTFKINTEKAIKTSMYIALVEKIELPQL